MTTGDSMDWTPGECCRKSAEICDEQDVDACIVIMLDKGPNGDSYNTMLRNSGFRLSEIVALLEIKKGELVRSINGG